MEYVRARLHENMCGLYRQTTFWKGERWYAHGVCVCGMRARTCVHVFTYVKVCCGIYRFKHFWVSCARMLYVDWLVDYPSLPSLSHRDRNEADNYRSCISNLPNRVSVYWHRADQFQHDPCDSRAVYENRCCLYGCRLPSVVARASSRPWATSQRASRPVSQPRHADRRRRRHLLPPLVHRRLAPQPPVRHLLRLLPHLLQLLLAVAPLASKVSWQSRLVWCVCVCVPHCELCARPSCLCQPDGGYF